MNLLCPNCQKMLTVPEQYAGQLMKCPMCTGTFTVPGLPPAPAAEAPTPVAAAEAAAGAVGAQSAEVYSVKQDAPPPPPPIAPDLDDLPSARRPAPEAAAPFDEAPRTAPSPPGEYTHTWTVWFSPRVLQFVPPAALLLVFVLQFFPWVGVYPGGVASITQTAWGAAFGGYTEDPDLRDASPRQFQMITEKELKANAELPDDKKIKDHRPGVSVLTLFYLLLFLPTLVVTAAALVLTFVHPQLPPAVARLMPWRWGIVAALNALVLLFLGMQLLLNFKLESNYKAWVNDNPELKKEGLKSHEQKQADALRGMYLERLQRTFWLRLAVALHVLALAAAALVFWLHWRGERRPLPKVELMW